MADMNQTLHDDNGSEQGINDASRNAGAINETSRAGNQSAHAEPSASAKRARGGRPRRTAARVITPTGKRGRPRKAKAADAEKPARARKAAEKPADGTQVRKVGTAYKDENGRMHYQFDVPVWAAHFYDNPQGLQKQIKNMLFGLLGAGALTLSKQEMHNAAKMAAALWAKQTGGEQGSETRQNFFYNYIRRLYEYVSEPAPALGTDYIRQGVGTNAINKIHKKRFALNGYKTVMDSRQGSAGQLIMQGQDVIDKAVITFNGSADILPPSGMKVLIILTIKAVKNLHETRDEHEFLEMIARASVVQTTVKEIARMLGIADLDYVRRLIVDTIKALEKVWTEFYDTIDEYGRHTDKPQHWETSIIQAHTPKTKIINRGAVNVVFALMYMKYLYGCSGAQYPLVLLRIDMNRDALAWPIGNKLFELSRIRKSNHIVITFDTLAHSCRAMKQYDEFDKKDKAQGYQRLLVIPVENALDALRDTYHYILDWKYTGAKGRELTDAETLGDRLPYHSKVDSFTGVGDRNISITLNPNP